MRRTTQALLLALLGAVMLRIGITDVYLRYVTPWMKWPLVLSGLLLLLAAVGPLLRPQDDDAVDDKAHDGPDSHDGHAVPRVTWLLILPGVIAFVVSPPELGSFAAERQAGTVVQVSEPDRVSELDGGRTPPIAIDEFLWRAQTSPDSLAERPVTLTGFVSYGSHDSWYVTRIAISCCAADAVAYQVEVRDAERPDRDAWVEVTGVHIAGTGTDRRSLPALSASSVEPTEAPSQTYE